MPALRASLNLAGFLQVAARKWRRSLNVHRSGLWNEGLVELRTHASKPGGSEMIQMQVGIPELALWCFGVLKWIGETREWHDMVTEQQMEDAQAVLETLEE